MKCTLENIEAMKNQPFSVCMCVYAGDVPQYFADAVESILNQSAKPDEVVIVVDGPVSDGMNAVIAEYESRESIQVIRLQENRGHGIARNVGIENCTHALVALMDADDLSVPERFEKQLAVFAQDAEVAVVGGQIAEFVEDQECPVGVRRVPLTDSEIKTYLKTRCPMNQVTVMFKRAEIAKAGGYLDWYCNEDYYLWNRMYLMGMRFANIEDVLVNVRVGAEMYQRRGGWKYFCSELKLQNFMLKNHVIGMVTYLSNVAKRVIVQLLLPHKIRSMVFQKFAREQ